MGLRSHRVIEFIMNTCCGCLVTLPPATNTYSLFLSYFVACTPPSPIAFCSWVPLAKQELCFSSSNLSRASRPAAGRPGLPWEQLSQEIELFPVPAAARKWGGSHEEIYFLIWRDFFFPPYFVAGSEWFVGSRGGRASAWVRRGLGPVQDQWGCEHREMWANDPEVGSQNSKHGLEERFRFLLPICSLFDSCGFIFVAGANNSESFQKAELCLSGLHAWKCSSAATAVGRASGPVLQRCPTSTLTWN